MVARNFILLLAMRHMTISTALYGLIPVLGLFATPAVSAEPTPAAEQVIVPQIERRDVHIPKIDATDIEIGAFTGKLSVEDFGAESSSGYRLAYHVTEDFFVEGIYGESIVSDLSFRRLGIAVLNTQQVKLKYYYMSIGYNLFPGEVFFGKNWGMTSAVYLIGGVGQVSFNLEDHTAFNYGIGIRVLPLDWCSIRFEMRDHVFDSDLLGKNELKHNFEMTVGLAAYF